MRYKKHGQVEKAKRIDSFESSGRAFQIAPFELVRFVREDNEIRIGARRIELERVYNVAGWQTFFLCPYCGKRVRFLYLPDYKCRGCAKLNYRCQQITKGSVEALQSIPAKIGAVLPPRELFELIDDYSLSRPPYMRQRQFEKYRQRYQKHEDAFIQRETGRYLRLINHLWRTK